MVTNAFPTWTSEMQQRLPYIMEEFNCKYKKGT